MSAFLPSLTASTATPSSDYLSDFSSLFLHSLTRLPASRSSVNRRIARLTACLFSCSRRRLSRQLTHQITFRITRRITHQIACHFSYTRRRLSRWLARQISFRITRQITHQINCWIERHFSYTRRRLSRRLARRITHRIQHPLICEYSFLLIGYGLTDVLRAAVLVDSFSYNPQEVLIELCRIAACFFSYAP